MLLKKPLVWLLHLLRLGQQGVASSNSATINVQENATNVMLKHQQEVGIAMDGTAEAADMLLLLKQQEVGIAVDGTSEAMCREEVPPPRSDSYEINEMYFGEDLGVTQVIDTVHTESIQRLLSEARLYMQNVVYKESKYAPLRSECKNQHENCAFWASVGECQNNPGYMNVSCAPICHTCEYLSIETRCPLDPNAVDAWYPGDLNRMFERITTQPEYQQFGPKVLSRPDYADGDTPETADYQLGPWFVVMEHFASPAETARLVELGAQEGYERSADVGQLKFDGTFDNYVNEGRTSTNAWCQHDCYTDPLAKAVIDRIQNLTGMDERNSEYLQLLRYEQGQFYQTHHDLIPHQTKRQEGVRLLTVYIYLNDVEEGGGTNFPHLNLTVQPKRGRTVLWPSVLNENPNKLDWRTEHQALPVIKGVKYGANAWIHQRDFKTPNANGCS